jgi:hypothetical protein
LGETPITDAGLQHLSGLINLRALGLFWDSEVITHDAKKKLAEVLPQLVIWG